MRVPVDSPIIRGLLIACVVFCLLWIGLAITLPRVLDINQYRNDLTTLLEGELKRPVMLGEGTFSWRIGPTISFTHCTILEPDRSAPCVTTRSITVRLGILPLIRKRIALRNVSVDDLTLTIARDRQGRLSIDDLLQPSSGGMTLSLDRLKLNRATIIWHDRMDGAPPLDLVLTGVNGTLVDPGRGEQTKMDLKGTIADGGGTLALKGKVLIPKDGNLRTSSRADLTVTVAKLDYGRFWRYGGQSLPFPNPQGLLSGSTAIKGKYQDLKLQADLTLTNPHLRWPTVFRSDLRPATVGLAGKLDWSASTLTMKNIVASIDGVRVKGGMSIRDLNSKDPYLDAQASSSPFSYAMARQYTPFVIIDPDPAEFIEQRIKGGTFAVQTATLKGRLSTIKSFGVKTNATCLYLRGSVSDGIISYGGSSPTFNKLYGTLELKGTSFNLIKTRGQFGAAPFTLDGSITEYATIGVPCNYPFVMRVTPHQSEVNWISSIIGLSNVTYGGNGLLELRGDGPTNRYRLSGEWHLQPSTLTISDLITKPIGQPASLNFSSTIDRNTTTFNSVALQVASARVSGSGGLRYSGQTPHLQFNLETNRFPLDPTHPLVPMLKPYQVRGSVQAQVRGAGDPRSLAGMKFHGTAQLQELSLKPKSTLPTLSNLNGTVTLKGSTLETTSMAVTYGTSQLQVKGSINNLANPEADLTLFSYNLNLADIGLTMPREYSHLRQLSTHLTLRDGQMVVRQLTGRFPRTGMSLSGTIPTGDSGTNTLKIALEYLDLDEPPVPTSTGSSPSRPLSLTLSAAAGDYDNTRFTNLHAVIEQNGATTTISQLKTKLLGGNLTLSGSYKAKDPAAPSRMAFKGTLEHARATALLQRIGAGRELTGVVTIKADLTSEGDDALTRKKNLNGSVSITSEPGVLKRFSTISKVISLLNVSQLLSFSLPDMARGGMPYTKISGSAVVKDGIISTKDFSIDSNVMNMTAVGTIDLPKEQVAMTIGVQPLQTVDKIINRLPVVGWVLSGGEGHTLSTYFEVSGPMSDPDVRAIPVQSIAVGTMEVFQRVFQLPIKLFTDTGDILLGPGQKKKVK